MATDNQFALLKYFGFAAVFLVVVSLLLECQGAGSSWSDADRALREAVRTGDVVAARRAIEQGANVHQPDRQGSTLLHSVAWAGNQQMASLLLEHGARADRADHAFGATPLHSAVRGDNPAMVSLLLEAGANTEVRTRADIEQCASGFQYPAGSTAADMARIARHREVEVLLLQFR